MQGKRCSISRLKTAMGENGSDAPSSTPALDNLVARAVSDFMRRVALPILVERGDRQELLGTGTIFEIHGKLVIVTAKHIFDGEDLGKIAIPVRPEGPTTDYIGDVTFISPNESDGTSADVCAIEMHRERLIQYIRDKWKILGLDDTTSAAREGQFVVCGFPTQLITPHSRDGNANLLGTLLAFYTNRIESPSNAAEPVNPELDLFFNHEGSSIRSLSGDAVESRRFQGVSGASI